MSVAYVFDLDDTLMSTRALFSHPRNNMILSRAEALSKHRPPQQKEPIYQNAYSHIVPPDRRLRWMLQQLAGPKYLFTNGTRMHARCAIRSLEIQDLFDGQLDRNGTLGALKPDPTVFMTMHKAVSNHCRGCRRIVFVDDLLANVQQGKRFGWQTVWINPLVSKMKYMPPGVDYGFPNIYVALEYLGGSYHAF